MNHYIGYITSDGVNASLARETKLPGGVSVVQSDSIDSLPDLPLAGLAYDLDHLWPGERERVLGELTAAPTAVPVVVHSYSLNDDQVTDLNALGVAVLRQPCEAIFRRLVSARAGKRRAA